MYKLFSYIIKFWAFLYSCITISLVLLLYFEILPSKLPFLIIMEFFLFTAVLYLPDLAASFILSLTPSTTVVTGNLDLHLVGSSSSFQSRVEDTLAFSEMLIPLKVILPNKGINLLNTLLKNSWLLGSCHESVPHLHSKSPQLKLTIHPALLLQGQHASLAELSFGEVRSPQIFSLLLLKQTALVAGN